MAFLAKHLKKVELMQRTLKTTTIALVLGCALALLALHQPAQGCTGILLRNADGSVVHGRTLEFGIFIKTDVIVVPRGYTFTSSAPNGTKGKKYTAKYAMVGCDMEGNEVLADGLNEAGLAVGAFYFPDYAQYGEINSANRAQAVAPTEFANYLLAQFATVDEVRQGLAQVVIGNTVFPAWGFVPPFHYVVYDKTGESITIEPRGGKLVVYDNPLGVLTNSPGFDWHLTNLSNYINLSPRNVPPVELGGLQLKQFGQGSGMHGLPGDFTPPSRFVQAAIFSQTAMPAPNAEQGILQTFHILNQFDIPVGVAREKDAKGQIHTDYTIATVARDPQSLRYYWRTYDDQTIRMVDLKQVNLQDKTLKKLSTAGQQPVVDMTGTLK